MKEVTFSSETQPESAELDLRVQKLRTQEAGFCLCWGWEQGGKGDGAWSGGGKRRQMESRVLGFTTAPRASLF